MGDLLPSFLEFFLYCTTFPRFFAHCHRLSIESRALKPLHRPHFAGATSTTAPLTESSRGKEGSLGRQQDLQDASPDPLFHPALIAAGHGRPGSEALGQFAPARASMRDPEHTFHHQAMIDRRTPCRRLLWRQEWAHLLPVDVRGGGQGRQTDGSGQLIWHRWSLTRAAQDMKASGCRLVLAPKARPVQSPGLLLLRFAEGVE